MSQRYTVRRLDLRLRAEFPDLTSEIFELGPHHHMIHVPADQLDAEAFRETFNREWRPVTARVELSNERPAAGVRLPSLADAEIGANLHGLHFTRSDIETVLAGLFPDLPPVTSFEGGAGHELVIGLAGEVPGHLAERLNAFLVAEMQGRPYRLTVAAPKPKEAPTGNEQVDRFMASQDALAFKPIHRRPDVPDFVREEEEWWFENTEKLFTGAISPRSFDVRRRGDNETACYIHPSGGPQIDVRQTLLAYDVIYMELPLEDDGPVARAENLPSFWQTQQITKDDFLKLVACDRVRLIRSQPEERSDLGLLAEARKLNPTGVIGRRMSAAMMIADIVETADEYLFGKPSIQNDVRSLIDRIAVEARTDRKHIAQFILYPQKTRRECFGPLFDRGLMAFFHGMGQGEVLAEAYKRLREKDVALEAGSFGQPIHTAHMLDATFIPQLPHQGYVSSWLGPMNLMGDRLNFYRSMNDRVAAAWAANERRKVAREIALPPVPLFAFGDRYGNQPTIDQIIELTSYPGERRKGRALVSRLASLPDEERSQEIDTINRELGELEQRRSKIQRPTIVADAIGNLAAYTLGWTVFPFVPAFTLTHMAIDYAKRTPVLHHVVDEVEQALSEHSGKNEDITFLSRVNRVATLGSSKNGNAYKPVST